jgi:hypothetical protein
MAMFAAAFIAMRSVRMLPVFLSPAEEIAPPTIIRFELPAPKPLPKPVPRATAATPAPTTVVAPTAVPTSVAPVAAQPAAVVAAPADSAATPRSRIGDIPELSRGLIPPPVIAQPRGAAIDRAAVVAPFRPLSAAERDSIYDVMMRAMMAEVHRPLTKEEKETLTRMTEPGRGMANTRAGSDGKVVPLMNGGVSSAVTGGQMVGGSFALPLFSKGPSPAQRKRDAAIDSTNRLILYRLQERARLLRDSLRADSLAKRIRP